VSRDQPAALPEPGDERALRRVLDSLPSRDDTADIERARDLAVPDEALAHAAFGLMDLTSLDAADTPSRVRRLATRALTERLGGRQVAGVCVWPDLVGEVSEVLAGSGIRAAAVAGAFPSARSPLAVRVAEVEAAVAAGAHEIDLVLDRGALLDGREWEAHRQVAVLVEACGRATCKVILETGSLPDTRTIARAAWVAMLAGADMVKTSTGKDGPGASAAAVLVLVEEALAFERHTGRAVGVKASGGIRDVTDATGLLALVQAVGGPDLLEPRRTRLGASSLLDALLTHDAPARG
jgi:deoxyribose-phosphate aldolase